jgi:hypothetical protein
MVWRVAVLVWGALGTAGAVLWATGGTVDPSQLLDGVAGLGALCVLLLVVKMPWDLYFSARAVHQLQEESQARSIPVVEAEKTETRRLAGRLLMLALGLHLVGAALCGALSLVTDGQVGLFAAAAFLLSMGLRPAVAMVGHVQRRLRVLSRRAQVPREDAVEFAKRLKELERSQATISELVHHEQTGLVAVHAGGQALEEELGRRLLVQEQRFRQDMDRVCVEFERSIEKLTADQELLAGIRAFLAMVRQQPG